MRRGFVYYSKLGSRVDVPITMLFCYSSLEGNLLVDPIYKMIVAT